MQKAEFAPALLSRYGLAYILLQFRGRIVIIIIVSLFRDRLTSVYSKLIVDGKLVRQVPETEIRRQGVAYTFFYFLFLCVLYDVASTATLYGLKKSVSLLSSSLTY